MPQKVPVQIWADARRAGARSRATTAPDADTAVDNRRDDCIDRARQLVERGDGPMGPGNPLGGRRRRVKGAPARHPVFAPRRASAARGRDLREGPHLEHGLKAVRHTSHDDRMSLSSFDLLSLAAERSRRLGEWLSAQIERQRLKKSQLAGQLVGVQRVFVIQLEPVSYTHLRAPRDMRRSRMPSSA